LLSASPADWPGRAQRVQEALVTSSDTQDTAIVADQGPQQIPAQSHVTEVPTAAEAHDALLRATGRVAPMPAYRSTCRIYCGGASTGLSPPPGGQQAGDRAWPAVSPSGITFLSKKIVKAATGTGRACQRRSNHPSEQGV
jgi:hypothetical protein